MGKAIQIGREVTNRKDVEQLLIEVDQLSTCPGFKYENNIQRSSKCMSYIKGKQITCNNCRILKNNYNKRSPKKTLKQRNTMKRTRNLTKKVIFYFLHCFIDIVK